MDCGATSSKLFIAPIDFPERNMLMPRKPALLLSLLNLVFKPVSGQTKASPNQFVVLPPHPPADDREAWRAYWKAQGQPWRTEPEIDEKRQKCLAERRNIAPNVEQGIYPFKDIKLSRADVEWLTMTQDDGRGPVTERIAARVRGVDLRGADLRGINLSRLPLNQLRGGLGSADWRSGTQKQREEAAIHLEGADLNRADLTGASLRSAHMEGADLRYAWLEGANLRGTHLGGNTILPPADLRHVSFDHETSLEGILLGNDEHGWPRMADIYWGNVNLAVINWSQVKELGDEHEARQKKTSHGEAKDEATRLNEYQAAVRAYRQLATALQDQELNESAISFAYHAQVLQKRVWWFQMTQRGMKLEQRMQAFGAWLFSWFLFLLAGYGYRLWRSFLAYVVVIIGFTTVYYLLGATFKPSLSLVNALGLSMTSFHGRGFFPGITQLNDTLTILASLEAFVGLILEATFIATLTQRFFGK